MASLLAGSPLLARAARSAPVLRAQTHTWVERDAQRVRLRAGDVRERPAVGLRLHRARRRRRMEPSTQPSGVRLGRSDSRQGGRSVDRRSLVGAARPEAEISHPHRADGNAGGAASRRRGGDVSRRFAVVEYADVPEQQLEPVGRAGGEGGGGTVVVAVLSAAGPGRQPGTARARAGRRLYRDGHHGRSAGVVLRAQPARSQSGRHARAEPAAEVDAEARPGRRARVVQGARTIPRQLERRRSAAAPLRLARRMRGRRRRRSPSRCRRVSRRSGAALVQLGIPRPGEEVHQGAHHHQRASSPPKTRVSASSADSMASSCRITAADRWTTVRRRSKRCPRSSRR